MLLFEGAAWAVIIARLVLYPFIPHPYSRPEVGMTVEVDLSGFSRLRPMATGLKKKYCANHPERLAHSLCMSCRKMVCQECATEWDGINYCVACLKLQRSDSRRRGSAFTWAILLLGGGLTRIGAVEDP